MPPHDERVAKNYEGLCIRCLKNPNREWMCVDTIVNNWNLCEDCNAKESDQKN